MSQGLFSIGGIASGLDTHGIIEQLMKLERQPMVRLQQQQTKLLDIKNAWQQVTTKLSSLRTAVDAISRPHRFDDLVKVSSSDPDAVSVSRSGAAPSGALAFTVDRLATRMQQSSADAFSSPSSALGNRPLSVTVGDTTHDVTADLGADATLADLVKAVNDLGIGVRARALQVTAGSHQLVLESTDTGVANGFSLSGANWRAIRSPKQKRSTYGFQSATSCDCALPLCERVCRIRPTSHR
jgi:flagellar hook-associated protein 2